jgi:hypothetical protein
VNKKKTSKSTTQPAPIQVEVATEELWRGFAEALTDWGELQEADCKFGSWAKKENPRQLNAGCLYEYARESRIFRCLLVKESTPREKLWWPPFALEFKGDSSGFHHLSMSGWRRWLCGFADELIANKSFADLLSATPDKVKESLDVLRSYSLFPKPVELAERPVRSFFWSKQSGSGIYPGLEELRIRVCWRHYRNDQIGEEMKRLAKDRRPREEPEPPTKKGRGKATSVIAFLDWLSAMRLRSHYPKRGTANAIDKFDDFRLGKRRGVPIYSDLDGYAGDAQRQFEKWFPFGEPPANFITWAERQRLNH